MPEEDLAILNDLKEYVSEQQQVIKAIKRIKRDPNHERSLLEIKESAEGRLQMYNKIE